MAENENTKEIEKEPMLKMEWHFHTEEEMLLAHAVLIPEIEALLMTYGLGLKIMNFVRGDRNE